MKVLNGKTIQCPIWVGSLFPRGPSSPGRICFPVSSTKQTRPGNHLHRKAYITFIETAYNNRTLPIGFCSTVFSFLQFTELGDRCLTWLVHWRLASLRSRTKCKHSLFRMDPTRSVFSNFALTAKIEESDCCVNINTISIWLSFCTSVLQHYCH